MPIIDECLRLAHGKAKSPVFSGLTDKRLVYFEKKKDAVACRTTAELWEGFAFTDAESLFHAARYRASPVYADGKIYLAARDGMITVVKAGPNFAVLAQNQMPGSDHRLPGSLRRQNLHSRVQELVRNRRGREMTLRAKRHPAWLPGEHPTTKY